MDVKEDFLHKEYPKQFARDDFWRQIKRTVNGEPATLHDITLIVRQINERLQLHRNDHLLDLGCGNGALGSELFDSVASYHGIDFSDYLLEIAREHFCRGDKVSWQSADIRDVEMYCQEFSQANKVLLYGCVAYLKKSDTAELLGKLSDLLPELESIFIGNIPRRERAAKFYALRNIDDFDLDDPKSQIGVWWDANELVELARELGFRSTSHQMPTDFYGSQYRFDLSLER